jgi:cytochrome c biogenesis protein CcmG/thiol:disulfide interchange protein DsbE
MSRLRPALLLPMAILLALLALLGRALHSEATPLTSARLNQQAPLFQLERLDDAAARLGPQDLKGEVWVLNVFASWCSPCRAELPALKRLADASGVRIVGLDYKDPPELARSFLQQHGNPYAVTLRDPEGRAGIDWGVVGVPETFVIDRQGVVRLKHVGPVTDEALRRTLLPLIKKLNDA